MKDKFNDPIPGKAPEYNYPGEFQLDIFDKNDPTKFPYKGLCGKCQNYYDHLDKDCLCDMCRLMGVKRIAPIPEEVFRFVKPNF